MTGAEITAIVLGVPAIIGAITSLIVALRSNGKSTATAATLAAHLEPAKAAALAAHDEVLSVPCSRCGAEPGARCINYITTKPTDFVHAARVATWSDKK
jgi:hypothetical protein